jgi:hypothetical protein
MRHASETGRLPNEHLTQAKPNCQPEPKKTAKPNAYKMGQVNIAPKAPKKRARIWHNSFRHMHGFITPLFQTFTKFGEKRLQFSGQSTFPKS